MKNGERYNLTEVPEVGHGDATSVFVSGEDVYVVSYSDDNGGSRCLLWENGKKSVLFEKGLGAIAWTGGMFVHGGDVYVAGATDGAVIMKNGVAQYLPFAEKK